MSTFWQWWLAAPVMVAEVIVVCWVIRRLEPWWSEAIDDFIEQKNREREERHQ